MPPRHQANAITRPLAVLCQALTILTILALSLACSPASQAHAAEPILVGGLFAESGPSAFVGTPSRLVAEMAVKDINAAGGVLGRPLKLIAYDTQSDPNLALRLARQLVESDKVLTIIGPTRTDSGMAVKRYTEEKGVVSIMTVGGDPIIAGGDKFGPFKWTFKTPQRTATAAKKIFEWLQAKGVSRIAILTAKDGFGQDGRQFLTGSAKDYGLTIVAEETMDPSETDYSAQAFKLALAKPQAVLVWTIGPAGSVAAKNLAALPGEHPLVVQCHGQPGPKYIELAGKAAEGSVMPSTKLMAAAFLPDSDPQKTLITRFIKDYKEAGLDAKFPLNTHSGYAYDALLLLVEGLKKAGTAEPAPLRQAIESLTGVVGLSGVFSLTPEDHNGLGLDSMVMLEVKNGAFVPAK